MLTAVKVIAVTGDSYSVELMDSDLGKKNVCFHMSHFDQTIFDRIINHLHNHWVLEGNGKPETQVEIDVERIKNARTPDPDPDPELVKEPEPVKAPESIKPILFPSNNFPDAEGLALKPGDAEKFAAADDARDKKGE